MIFLQSKNARIPKNIGIQSVTVYNTQGNHHWLLFWQAIYWGWPKGTFPNEFLDVMNAKTAGWLKWPQIEWSESVISLALSQER